MAQYKANCKIDKNDGKGNEIYPIYIKEAEDDAEAHELAKHYMLTTFPEWSLYKIETVKI
jgi:hypothetical protein